MYSALSRQPEVFVQGENGSSGSALDLISSCLSSAAVASAIEANRTGWSGLTKRSRVRSIKLVLRLAATNSVELTRRDRKARFVCNPTATKLLSTWRRRAIAE